MVAGLVFRGILGGIGRGLFQEAVNSYGSWERGFVEEGDHIEGFVLDRTISANIVREMMII